MGIFQSPRGLPELWRVPLPAPGGPGFTPWGAPEQLPPASAGAAGRGGETGIEAETDSADLVINATPVGMTGTDEGDSGWLVPPSWLHRGQVVVDLVYAPRPTPWLTAAGQTGAIVVDGLGMLVHQAAAQLELWTGRPAPVDRLWRAASDAV